MFFLCIRVMDRSNGVSPWKGQAGQAANLVTANGGTVEVHGSWRLLEVCEDLQASLHSRVSILNQIRWQYFNQLSKERPHCSLDQLFDRKLPLGFKASFHQSTAKHCLMEF